MVNVFDVILQDTASEITECLMSKDGIRIERIVSNGQSSADDFWYDQEEHEWVLVLSGYGVIEFEGGSKTRLNAGDYVNIAAHKKHRVAKTAPDGETIWLAIFYR